MGFLYRLVRGFLRLGLRAFFREIEVQGGENLPHDGPCIVAANHHNSMMDPFLLVGAVDRPMCFIAKAPLFKVPILGSILRALRCIPAHRSQDSGYSKEKNEALYAAAAGTLARGAALAIFPEGKSHSEPQLAEFRHGASKIAMEAETLQGGVRIQLVGLHFERTRGFRGKVLIQLGPPIAAAAYLERYKAEPRDAVAALTSDLQSRLSEMILTAESAEVLRLADLLARMRALQEIGRPHETAEAFDRKKLILERYRLLREREPVEVEALRLQLLRYEGLLHRIGIREEHVATDYRIGPVLRTAALNTLMLAIGLPFLALGIATNYVPYLLCTLAARIAGRLPDRRASAAFFSALIAFPAFWTALGVVVGRRWGVAMGLLAGAAGPLSGLVALEAMDRWHRVLVQTGGLWMAIARPSARAMLRRLRRRALARADRLLAIVTADPKAS